LMSSTLFAYTVVEWGQPQLLIQEVARRPERSGTLLGGALAMRTAGCALAAVVTGGFLWAAGYGARTGALAAMFVVAWLPTSLTGAFGQVFRGHERMDVDARTTVIAKALTLATIAPVLWLGGRLPTVILALGLAGLASLLVVEVRARRLQLA